jgi:drug/metabolite transporter (DMT)-like permease
LLNKNLLGIISLMAASTIWGGSVVAQKIALQTWSPYFVLFVRGGGTLLLILPYLWLRNQIDFSSILKDRAILAGMSLAGLANSLFVLLGLQYTTAMEAGMIMGSSPILMALLLKGSGRKSLDKKGWGAALITLFGVVLVVFHPRPEKSLFKPEWFGDLLVFFGVVCWSVYTIFSKEAMKRHSPFLITALTWAGVILVFPLIFNEQSGADHGRLLGWGALFYIVVIATVLGFFLWLYGLRRVGEAHASVFLNFIPLSAILFSAGLLGESIYLRQWIGGGLILFGAWIITWPGEKQDSLA